MENLHQQIEEHIVSSMAGTGIKYSLTKRNARDFSLPDAPLLSQGSDNYIIFTTIVNSSTPSAVGNVARRQSGIIRIDCYLSQNLSTDRDYYRMLDTVADFLEAKNVGGVHLRNLSSSGEYDEGNWQVKSSVVSFESNKMRN